MELVFNPLLWNLFRKAAEPLYSWPYRCVRAMAGRVSGLAQATLRMGKAFVELGELEDACTVLGPVRALPPACSVSRGSTRVAGSMHSQLQLPFIGTLHGTDMATRLPGKAPHTWNGDRSRRCKQKNSIMNEISLTE